MTKIPSAVEITTIIETIQKIFDSCADYEKSVLYKILGEFANNGESSTYENVWLADYKEMPVDINTFIESDLYLGKVTRNGKGVFPAWRDAMREIFTAGNRYDEVIFTGATRTGKTSTAITCVSYMLHRLMCLRNPQEFFGQKEVSAFSIFFMNVTKDLARGVAFREFNNTLSASPWFNAHGNFTRSDRNPIYVPEGGKIILDYGSDSSHALGAQAFCAVMDEANFSRSGVKDITIAKQHMMDVYNTIYARITGTFRKNGEVYGKLFAISSKKDDNDFLETHIQTKRTSGAGEHMYIFDKPQWDVLPPGRFSDETFYIAVGDRYHRGFVIPENQTQPDALQELESQGYTILTPPEDVRPQFVADFDIALRDIAGISIPGMLSFITQESLDAVINKGRRNPFLNEILQIGTKDARSLEEFFHTELVESLKRQPLFIHMDLSINTDKTGMAGVAITSRKDVDMGDGKKISMPYFSQLFGVSIEAPRGSKIPYAKILAFVVWLRKTGFNIAGISMDTFQSEYMVQLLESQGFEVDKRSLDRSPDGYITLRSVILEERIDMLDIKLQEDELVNLQRDSFSGRIDHPVGGSKDLSDCLAGAVWNATLKNPAPRPTLKNTINVINSVNGARPSSRPNGPLDSLFPYNNNRRR